MVAPLPSASNTVTRTTTSDSTSRQPPAPSAEAVDEVEETAITYMRLVRGLEPEDDDLAEEEEASVNADDATHQAVDSPDYLEDSE